jgi:superoxide dismutase, Fe-Mn family
MAFTLPDLPFPFNALEPHIDAKTMEIHHDKHHGTYVSKLNTALEKAPSFQGKPIEEILKNLDAVPAEVRTAVRNHGGGHLNHSLFWKMLSPKGGGKPTGALAAAIDKAFGSFDVFKEQFGTAAANHFGSGWAWLCADSTGKLVITTLPNQDNPVSQGLKALLGLDVWEHAYYLKYQNRRPEYVSAFWNIVSWEQVAANFAAKG